MGTLIVTTCLRYVKRKGGGYPRRVIGTGNPLPSPPAPQQSFDRVRSYRGKKERKNIYLPSSEHTTRSYIYARTNKN